MGDPDGYECVKVALPRRPHIGVHGLCARVPIDARTVVLCVAHARCDQLTGQHPVDRRSPEAQPVDEFATVDKSPFDHS